MSEDPFSDPPTILVTPSRGRSPKRSRKMEPEIQEVRIVEPRSKSSKSANPSGTSAPPVPPKRRSASQDEVLKAAAAAEKARAAKASKGNKKGGTHVDVIDRLDYSGVGPATFHHDGPFDACAPSRNRHRTKAPMLAWTPGQDPNIEQNGILGAANNNSRVEPLETSIRNLGLNDSPYSPTTKKSKASRDLGFEYPRRPASPKRRDTLADAWGKGEPEPFEEFFAESVSPAAVGQGESGLASAASSIRQDKEGHSSKTRRTNGGIRKATNRPPLPPPQPIFPETTYNDEDYPVSDVTYGNAGGPRRSKSLMQRIKKMRDAPNVPVDYDETPHEQSGSSSENYRPTHRAQNSLLRGGNKSPTSPGFSSEGEKALPGLPPPSVSPRDEGGNGYFDRGIGRKTSIMQKVRGVVGKAK
ncbi:hypothetical protein CPB86DRAFT_267328 [Serendipita vermifera]|nr:hypothetical protein CPB86DRAFT_267328 [Serendipita vermifera]